MDTFLCITRLLSHCAVTFVLRQRVDVEIKQYQYIWVCHLLGTVVSLVTFVLGCQSS